MSSHYFNTTNNNKHERKSSSSLRISRQQQAEDDENNGNSFDYDVDSDYSHKDMLSTTDVSSYQGNGGISADDDDYEDDDAYDNHHRNTTTIGSFRSNPSNTTRNSMNDTTTTNNNNSNNRMTTNSSTDGDTNTSPDNRQRKISLSELVKCIGNEQRMLTNNNITPELERRVRDFRLAQQKRRAKYGATRRWGVFGMYNHLYNVRIDLEWVEDAAWRRNHHHPYLSWNDFEIAKSKTRTTPIFTYSLIAICTVMLIVEFGLNGWKVAPLNVNPMIGPSPEALIRAGARDTALIVNNGEWYRLFSPLILHAGIIHYVLNMIAFGLIGIAVEQSHGAINTLLLFIVPGVGGNILSAIFLPKYISVGASGGIFGLMGACIGDIGLNWKLLFIKNADEDNDQQVYRRNFWCVFCLVFEILINIVLGLITPFIDNWTHLGGLLYGVCCAFSLLPTVVENMVVRFFNINRSTCAKLRILCIRFLGLIITLLLIMASTIWLATTSDPNETPCPNCRYISCIPFPPFQEKKWRYCDDCDMVVGDIYMDPTKTYYDKIDLTCPNNDIASINITAANITDVNVILRNLPTYCRANCTSVYST